MRETNIAKHIDDLKKNGKESKRQTGGIHTRVAGLYAAIAHSVKNLGVQVNGTYIKVIDTKHQKTATMTGWSTHNTQGETFRSWRG